MARRVVSCERLISADASVIFDVLTDPSQHAAIDGSNTVQGHVGKQERLSLGSTFAMRMRLGVPYRIKSRVFEFAENRLIAWGILAGPAGGMSCGLSRSVRWLWSLSIGLPRVCLC